MAPKPLHVSRVLHHLIWRRKEDYRKYRSFIKNLLQIWIELLRYKMTGNLDLAYPLSNWWHNSCENPSKSNRWISPSLRYPNSNPYATLPIPLVFYRDLNIQIPIKGLLDFTSSDSEGKNFMKMLLTLLTD